MNAVKQKLSSLRIRMLLPVIGMTLFVLLLLTSLFSRSFINMILQQENEVNAVGFETVSRSVVPMIDASISEVRNLTADERIASYAALEYGSAAELVRARIECRDHLSREIARYDGIYGVLFMRSDESVFGALPEGNFFLDEPKSCPLPEAMTKQMLGAPLGETVWAGPVPASAIYGFQNDKTPRSVMIAAWRSVSASYGECYALMLMDETIFDGLFAAPQDGQST